MWALEVFCELGGSSAIGASSSEITIVSGLVSGRPWNWVNVLALTIRVRFPSVSVCSSNFMLEALVVHG